MAVRVKVSLVALAGIVGTRLDTVAVVNSGFEVDRPEILLPPRAAERLGLWPELPPHSSVVTYGSPGADFQCVRMPEASSVTVITADRASSTVTADVVVAETEKELLLSDMLASALQISILDLGRGEWCFRSQIDVPRDSAEPAIWT